MNHHHRFSQRTRYSLCGFLLASLLLCSWTSARTWTSRNGTSIQAKYISHSEDTVVIRRLSDFKEFTIPLSTLSDADQQWIKQTHLKTSSTSKSGSLKSNNTNHSHSLPANITSLIEKNQGRLILEDDFNRDDPPEIEQLGPLWLTNSPWEAPGKKQCDLREGSVHMKAADTSDAAVMIQHTFEQPIQDGVLWMRVKLLSPEHTYIAYSDPNYDISEFGRICGITLAPELLILEDHKFGYFSPEATAMKRSRNQLEKLNEHTAQFMQSVPANLSEGVTTEVIFILNQRKMTVYLGGEEISSYSSKGIAHPTKQTLSIISTEMEIDHLKFWDLSEQ